MRYNLAATQHALAVIVAFALLGAQQYECPFEKPLEPAKAVAVLNASKESWWLEHAAISLVQAKDPAPLDKLVTFLPVALSDKTSDQATGRIARPTNARISPVRAWPVVSCRNCSPRQLRCKA
jgi:2-succinyl-5-enolpyruvyl-6-hydroxy-3-cyclohexene-1-carboxylate synthase